MRALLILSLLLATARADEETPFQRFAAEHPKAIPIVFGAEVCLARATRSAALAEIAKEKKYGQVGGVVNKAKLYELQKQIRWADETEQKETKDARSWKAKPASCSNVVVKLAVGCKLDDSDSLCDSHIMEVVGFLSTYDDDSDSE